MKQLTLTKALNLCVCCPCVLAMFLFSNHLKKIMFGDENAARNIP